MSIQDEGFAVLPPEALHWRESNIMKIPNADPARIYPQDPRTLPQELAGHVWPPHGATHG